MNFIKDITQKKQEIVQESVSYEDALLARLEKLTESPVQEYTRGQDKVSMDVPLLLRIMEYAKEDAKTDMDLHHVADKLIELSIGGKVLTMDDYESIVSSTMKEPEQAVEPVIKTTESLDVNMIRMLAGLKGK